MLGAETKDKKWAKGLKRKETKMIMGQYEVCPEKV